MISLLPKLIQAQASVLDKQETVDRIDRLLSSKAPIPKALQTWQESPLASCTLPQSLLHHPRFPVDIP